MSGKINLKPFLHEQKKLVFMQIQAINCMKLIDVVPVIRLINLGATKALFNFIYLYIYIDICIYIYKWSGSQLLAYKLLFPQCTTFDNKSTSIIWYRIGYLSSQSSTLYPLKTSTNYKSIEGYFGAQGNYNSKWETSILRWITHYDVFLNSM